MIFKDIFTKNKYKSDNANSNNKSNSNNKNVNNSFNSANSTNIKTTINDNSIVINDIPLVPLVKEINDLENKLAWLQKDLFPKTNILRNCKLCYSNLDACLSEINQKLEIICQRIEELTKVVPNFEKQINKSELIFLRKNFAVLDELCLYYWQMIDVPLCQEHKILEEEMHLKGKEIKLLKKQIKEKSVLLQVSLAAQKLQKTNKKSAL